MNHIYNLFDPDPTRREENIFRALELVQKNHSSESEVILLINEIHAAIKMFCCHDELFMMNPPRTLFSRSDILFKSSKFIENLTKWYTTFIGYSTVNIQSRRVVHAILLLLPTLLNTADQIIQKMNSTLFIPVQKTLTFSEILNEVFKVKWNPSLVYPLLTVLENVPLNSNHFHLLHEQIVSCISQLPNDDISKLIQYIINYIGKTEFSIDWIHTFRYLIQTASSHFSFRN